MLVKEISLVQCNNLKLRNFNVWMSTRFICTIAIAGICILLWHILYLFIPFLTHYRIHNPSIIFLVPLCTPDAPWNLDTIMHISRSVFSGFNLFFSFLLVLDYWFWFLLVIKAGTSIFYWYHFHIFVCRILSVGGIAAMIRMWHSQPCRRSCLRRLIFFSFLALTKDQDPLTLLLPPMG